MNTIGRAKPIVCILTKAWNNVSIRLKLIHRKYFAKQRTGCTCSLLEYMQTHGTLNWTIPLRENVKALCIHQETVRMWTNATTSFGGSGTHDEMNIDDGVTCQSLGISIPSSTSRKARTLQSTGWPLPLVVYIHDCCIVPPVFP